MKRPGTNRTSAYICQLEPVTNVNTLLIDIEQELTNLCHQASPATLNLTAGSRWPDGYGTVLWSSAPAGLGGETVSPDGRSFTFSPQLSTPGAYTVTASYSLLPEFQDTCIVNIIEVQYSIHHVCTTGVHDASHYIEVTLTPPPTDTNIVFELRRDSGTTGAAVFMDNDSTTFTLDHLTCTTLTILGTEASSAVSNMVLEARLGDCVCTQALFTVVDLLTLTATDAGNAGNTTNDTTQADDTHTLYLGQGTNGTAELVLDLTWEPAGYPGDAFLWEILPAGGSSGADEWGGVTNGNFVDQPLTNTWDVANAAGGVTNREFQVRAWFDCNTNGLYDADEPHRIIDVTIIKVDLDIDSDNNNELNDPIRSAIEDALEDDPDHPGKALAINHLDRDKDGVPDFADGFDIEIGGVSQSAADASHDFVPVIFEFSDNIDTNTATVKFSGNFLSNPATDVSRTGTGTNSSPFVYSIVGDGRVRLWRGKNGSDSRLKASVTAGGDAILKDEVIPLSSLSPSNGVVRLYLEALKRSDDLGDIQIKVELNPHGTASASDYIASDQVKATVFGVDSVRPIRSDFAANHEGKVLISAKHGGGFHTTAITTRAGTAAQTNGTNVTISAYVLPLPPAGYTNLTVYFEVTDPDDLSHYEGKTVPGTPTVQGDENPNDNRDPLKRMTTGVGADYTDYQENCLTAGGRSARVQQPIAIDGTTRAVAETTLKITKQHSGDNYHVRATMQKPHNLEPFDKRSSWTTNDVHVTSSIKESETMIAWKRVYIEQDNMYTLGATITADAPAGATNLTVDSTADFTVGDSVVVFWTNGSFNATITDKPGSPVHYVYLTNPGLGYTNVPSVTISPPGGGGVQATASATTNRFGQITRITVSNGGTGYTNAPTVIIDPPGTAGGVQAQATATIGRLTISPALPDAITPFAGIRPAVEPLTYQVDRRYLPNAFGRTPDGSDGGAFIEFLDAPTGNGNVPKYTEFQNGIDLVNYYLYWFCNHHNRANNVLYLLAANRFLHQNARPYGVAVIPDSVCIVFDGQKINVDQRDDTAAHEIGHRFGLEQAIGGRFDHIDNGNYALPPVPPGKALLPADRWSHCNLDGCLMSYARNRFDTTVEFSIPCLLTGSSDGTDDSLRDRPDR